MGPAGWRPTLEKRPGATKYKLLAARIIGDIERDVLAPGTRMPTHRELARLMQVSVQTVSLAYKEAEQRGYLSGEVGRGTFVRARVTERADRFMLDRNSRGTTDLSIIRAVYTAEHEEASRALMAALAEADNSAFMRPCRPIAGLDRHRAAAAHWLERLGVAAERDRILVTNGAAQGVFLAVAAVVRPGDLVLSENLTDHGIIGLANVLGFTLRGLPTDAEGVMPDAFEAACRAGKVTALVLIPTFNNPTTSLMGAERRRAIADVARRHGVFVIEDEVYKPLCETALPSITAMIPDLGFFVTSFTKSVVTGLRVGYLVVPPAYSIRVGSILRVTGWSGTNLLAEMAARWIEDGTAERLVAVQRREIRARQAIVAEVLAPVVASTHPLALCALLEVPRRWSEAGLVRALAARGIAVSSSDPFVAGGERPARRLRICLGGRVTPAELRTSFERLLATFEQLPPVLDAGSIA
ncbi:MAG TPA: PLP-dependent aminotransferase family protein [Acetobacteraceae bacterium]|nr:PLP-dependent aminotransferase family protein [Acetobacteraceae bacterium]